jgi:hypothetical protein
LNFQNNSWNRLHYLQLFKVQNFMQIENYLACWTFGMDSLFFPHILIFLYQICIIPFKIRDDPKFDDLKKKKNWNLWNFFTTHFNKVGSKVFSTLKFMKIWGCSSTKFIHFYLEKWMHNIHDIKSNI